jgi:hypothetical protein
LGVASPPYGSWETKEIGSLAKIEDLDLKSATSKVCRRSIEIVTLTAIKSISLLAKIEDRISSQQHQKFVVD